MQESTKFYGKIKENYLNKDYESHAYVDFDYRIVIDIIKEIKKKRSVINGKK